MVKDLVLRYQQLKLQLGQMQSSGNLQSLQKSLSQQLTQAQSVRQKLLCQAPPTGAPPQPLKMQLSQTNEIITSLSQHYSQSQQMLSQQSPFSQRVKIEMRQQGHTHFSEGGGDLPLGIRDMSLSQRPQGIQQSRSASKLHRLISSQEDIAEGPYGSITPSSTYPNAPFSPSFRSSSATAMASSSLASKPVHQIQEFKPGVPWQPRKSDMAMAGKHQDHFQGGVQRSVSQSGNSFGQPPNRYGRFTRSQSTDNNYYGNQALPTSSRGGDPSPWSGNESRPQNFPPRGWNGGGAQRSGRMSLPATPVGAFPEHQAGWRQPPSTLLPKQDYQYKQYESSARRGSRSTPIDAHPDWFPETPTSADPVWGSGANMDQGVWPQHKNGRGWAQSEPLKEPFTPSSESKWTSDSVFHDSHWQGGNKTRLSSSSGVPLSPWLVIRTSSPQVSLCGIRALVVHMQ